MATTKKISYGMERDKSSQVPLAAVTDPDKYKIVFENKKVRVYDYKDKPGDKTKLHHHDAFVLHTLSAFKRRLYSEDGKSVVKKFKKGETFWSDAQNHIGENVGKTSTHVLIVEIK